MGNLNYKTMKKADWLALAESMGIEHYPKSTIRYFAEKIAEKIGVDDKIVKTDELKKQVIEKLASLKSENNSEGISEEVSTEENIETKPAEENVFDSEEVSEEVSTEEKLEPIEELRQKCSELGIGWNELHTIDDLKAIISAVEGTAIPNIATEPSKEVELENLPTSAQSDSEKEKDIKKAINSAKNSKFDVKQLQVYRDVINGGIRNHWRKMYSHEITELLSKANYPFEFVINKNPNNPLNIEILISMNGSKVRIPSDDKKQWIEIGG